MMKNKIQNFPSFCKLKEGLKHNMFSKLDGSKETTFEKIVEVGSYHFKTLFKANHRETINVILKVGSYFLSFIDLKGNENLMEKVTIFFLMRIL
jgi:hypothetical protein